MDYRSKLLSQDIVAMDVFLEKRTSRIYVGRLEREGGKYCFSYDKKYLYDDKSIPVGVDLMLTKQKYCSDTLFESLRDRIPTRQNPAYVDYCRETGIDVNETDPLILLTTIGRRGPSSFIFEPVYREMFSAEQLKSYREKLGLSMREFASVFQMSISAIQRIESNKEKGQEVLRRIELYVLFPELAIFEILRHGGCLTDKKRQQVLSVLHQICASY